MLRAALALFSSLQIGARIKQSLQRSVRQASIIAVAVLVLIAAAVFGLIATYHALTSIYQFKAVEAATIMCAGLLLVGLLVIAMAPLVGPKARHAKPIRLAPAGEGLGPVNEGLAVAMQQVGPLPLIVIAFTAGLLAGRR